MALVRPVQNAAMSLRDFGPGSFTAIVDVISGAMGGWAAEAGRRSFLKKYPV